MELTVAEYPGVNLVKVQGRLDHGSSLRFSELLHPYLENCKKGMPPLILCFAEVAYISSAGLRSLMIATRFAKSQGGQLAIAEFQPLVRDVFDISRFDLVIPCYESVEAAVKALV